MVCIIDAVDEAESAEILALIKSVTSSGSRAKFIVLSRPNVQIERQIDGQPCIVVEDENANDIKTIIGLGLDSLQKAIHSLNFDAPIVLHSRPNRVPRNSSIRQPRYRSLATTVARERNAMAEIRAVLVSKAQGSALWAKLVLDKLIQEAESNEGSTIEELRRAANQIPEELSEYYRRITEELTAQKPPRRAQEIRQALMWICAAAEIGDVTLAGLWEALAMLKGDFNSTTLDEIWQKRILINSYDELWRKLYNICGPFIEIFNPGLSAEESRQFRYGASSIVQLMHQSVRDFLCDPKAAGALYFSLDEAGDLARRHLEQYLSLVTSDHLRINEEGPQDPQLIVEWLDDQKLLQLAIKAAETKRHPIIGSLRATRGWTLQQPIQESDEAAMVNAIRQDECMTHEGRHAADGDNMLAIGRLLYHACTEGLATAVRNMLALGWTIPVEETSERSKIIVACILFSASRCGSTRVEVGLDLPFGPSLGIRPRPGSNFRSFGGIRRDGRIVKADPSPLRQCISITDEGESINEDRAPDLETGGNLEEPHSDSAEASRLQEDQIKMFLRKISESEALFRDRNVSIIRSSNGRPSRPDLSEEEPVAGQLAEVEPPHTQEMNKSRVGLSRSNSGETGHATQDVEGNGIPVDGFSELDLSDSSILESARQSAARAEAADPGRQTIEETAQVLYASRWVTVPWTVVGKVEREGVYAEQRASFSQWSYFLDLVCGSKKLASRLRTTERGSSNFEEVRGSEGGKGEGVEVAPIEDIEDAIFAALVGS